MKRKPPSQNNNLCPTVVKDDSRVDFALWQLSLVLKDIAEDKDKGNSVKEAPPPAGFEEAERPKEGD